MSNVIEPIIDKRTGEVKTNAQIVRDAAKILDRLSRGVMGESESARAKRLADYSRVTNNCDPQIIRWFEEAAKVPNDEKLQKFINDTLIPVEGAHDVNTGKRLSKAERIKGVE